MGDDESLESFSMLLGRPFLKTSRTKIDVDKETLTMKFDDKIVQFNINDAMRYPCDEHPISVNFIDSFMREKFSLSCEDALQVVLDK